MNRIKSDCGIDPSNWRANLVELHRIRNRDIALLALPAKTGKTQMMNIANDLSKARSDAIAQALNTVGSNTMGSYTYRHILQKENY